MKSEYQVAIPKDENNYTHRVCSRCQYRFGIRSANEAGEFPQSLFCPYCGNSSDLSSYNTVEQIEYATEEAQSQIFYDVQKDFQNMMKRSFSGSKNVKFKPASIRRKYIFPPLQSQIPTDMVCSSCNNEYVIFGISAKCPYCNKEDVKILDTNLAIIEKELNTDRALRLTYIDVVTTFQNECRHFATNAKGVKFQNIDSVEKHFKKSGVDILSGIKQEDIASLRSVFEKRHVGQHNNGTWDQKAVNALSLKQSLIGQKVTYSKDELASAVKALVAVSGNLRTEVKP